MYSNKINCIKYVIIECKEICIERFVMKLELLKKAIEEEYDLLKFKVYY